MKNAWNKIEKHLKARDLDTADSLRSPVTAEEVAAAEEALGGPLPPDLTASLAIHDGQNDGVLFDLWRLLPLEEIVSEWRLMREMLEAGEFDEFETEPDKKVQKGWWRKGWLPVASDGYGNLLCLDGDAAPRGRPGQVIVFWHDDAERPVLASRFLGWMRKAARELPREETPEQVVPVLIEWRGERRAFRNPKAAQIAARRGEPGPAEAALAKFAARGDAHAAASMALLRAYNNDWEATLEHAAAALEKLDDFYHSNVPYEMISLVAQGGERTGAWERVTAIGEALPASSYEFQAKELAESAAKREDLVNTDWRERRSTEENATHWANYEATGVPSTYNQTEQSRRRHRFLMAAEYEQVAEALRIVRAHPETCNFDDTLGVRRWLGDDEAWDLIMVCIDNRWHPPYHCQIAPAELLTDPRVRDLMSPDRCRTLLQTPRARWSWDFSKKKA